jgi:MerR family transcriptional regulator, redox-sensitive transcriptional activator SoxR
MLTIGQVAARAGLRASAVRYYEVLGLLPAAARRGGKRIYDPSIVDRLGVIALAKVAGFELREIRETLSKVGDSQPAPTWKRLGETKRVALDQQIARLTRMKDALAKLDGCRCDTLEGCGRAFNSARSSGMNGQTQ